MLPRSRTSERNESGHVRRIMPIYVARSVLLGNWRFLMWESRPKSLRNFGSLMRDLALLDKERGLVIDSPSRDCLAVVAIMARRTSFEKRLAEALAVRGRHREDGQLGCPLGSPNSAWHLIAIMRENLTCHCADGRRLRRGIGNRAALRAKRPSAACRLGCVPIKPAVRIRRRPSC